MPSPLPSFFAAAAVVACAGASAASAGCGPSYQAVYEADVNFEHCYALDDQAEAPLLAKRDCWQTWRAKYAAGQPRDKSEYAATRAEALSRGSAVPTDDSMMAAAPGEGHASQVVAPQLTNAFAPPPKTLDDGDGGIESNIVNPSTTRVTWNAASAAGADPNANWLADAGALQGKPSGNGSAPAPAHGVATRTSAQTQASHATGTPVAPAAACSGSCTTTWGECRDTCKGASCTACDGGYRKCMRGCFQ